MPRGRPRAQSSASIGKEITAYPHRDKTRRNNPEIGAVNATNDPQGEPKVYSYDPYLEPTLVWAGKAERTSFEIPTVSLHVHERVEPLSLVKAMEKEAGLLGGIQGGLFDDPEELELRRKSGKVVGYYQHDLNWKNRLIAGDSLLVMNSLLEKEGMAGQVQMVYIDPPYGIKYGSNFQPFTDKKDVKDGKDENLTSEPEMIKAFRDTWELGIHSYLTYMRDRLLLASQLLSDTGSCFVQISDENVHHIRELMDEVFGAENFISQISFKTKKMSLGRKYIGSVNDYILWYSKRSDLLKFNRLFVFKAQGEDTPYSCIELPDGTRRRMTKEEKETGKFPTGSKVFRTLDLHSSGRTESCVFEFEFQGQKFSPQRGKSWKTNRDGINNLIAKNRLVLFGKSPEYILYHDDYPVSALMNVWEDTQGESDKVYVVQTSNKVLQRCILMATQPGDLVLDITCGSGTTAAVAEEWGRRWITCDTSRVALTLAKQRLMTSTFDYFELARPVDGVSGGFKYKTVPHITLGAIAQNETSPSEILYDQPVLDRSKIRVTGPFTVEAVPAPIVKPLDDAEQPPAADASIAREGATVREADWRGELLRSGIQLKGGQKTTFTRVEPLQGCRWLHALDVTEDGKRAVVSFGPDHAPMTPADVERAYTEARQINPDYIVYAAFQFDPEAAKDIDELNPSLLGFSAIKVAMNPDLLTADLRKKQSTNQSFWLLGRPDILVSQIKDGEDKGKWQVEVRGFDYMNPANGEVESGGTERVAMWQLDVDYDDRSMFPRQVFFPLAGKNEGWEKLRKDLKAQLDEEMLEAYTGCVSLPFEGERGRTRIAVKVIDNRGLESLRVMTLDASVLE